MLTLTFLILKVLIGATLRERFELYEDISNVALKVIARCRLALFEELADYLLKFLVGDRSCRASVRNCVSLRVWLFQRMMFRLKGAYLLKHASIRSSRRAVATH
jgi:hypothetical protein